MRDRCSLLHKTPSTSKITPRTGGAALHRTRKCAQRRGAASCCRGRAGALVLHPLLQFQVLVALLAILVASNGDSLQHGKPSNHQVKIDRAAGIQQGLDVIMIASRCAGAASKSPVRALAINQPVLPATESASGHMYTPVLCYTLIKSQTKSHEKTKFFDLAALLRHPQSTP